MKGIPHFTSGRIALYLGFLLAALAPGCGEEAKEVVSDATSIPYSKAFDIVVRGVEMNLMHVRLEDTIPNYDQVRGKIKRAEIESVTYQISNNAGTAGRANVYLNEYMASDVPMLVSRLAVGAGQNVPNATDLPLEPGGLGYINDLLEQEAFTVSWDGDAAGVIFDLHLVMNARLYLVD